MPRLEDVAVEDLEAALDDAAGRRETERLMAAIIYKRGPSAPMIAEWLDTREQTVYRWFDRLEAEPIERAVQDRDRPGRPTKLAAPDREQFEATVRQPPTAAGYDRPAWTTALATQYLEDEFDVTYSRRHVQRLLKDAGLTWQPPTADDERTASWETINQTD